MTYSNAWAAGFFDGEGCVRIDSYRSGSPGPLAVSISQMDMRPLRELQRRFGGYVGRRGDGCGKWTVRANAAARFLRSIRRWLLVKREQVDLAIEYQTIMRTAVRLTNKSPIGAVARRVEIRDEIKRLKKAW